MPLVVLAGKEYGSGSSRDWAAKGTLLLGVKAVIAESFERIHRSNLVNMGVLPLQFKAGETRGVARADRPRGVRRSSASATALKPRGDGHGDGDAPTDGTTTTFTAIVPHRHARGAGGVPPRRHPAVRAAAARRKRA